MQQEALLDSTELREIVSFRVTGQDFCIDIGHVREIRGWSPTTVLPHAPDYVKGVMNLRGNVIPVIDLSLRLGLGDTEPNQRNVIVISNFGRGTVGLLVEAVSDIMSVPSAELKPTPEVASSGGPSFVEAVFSAENSLIRVLDLTRVIPSTKPGEE